VESNSERYHVGDVVNGMTGWQEWAIASESNKFTVLPKGLGLDLATVMNVLGATGLTAYFGLWTLARSKRVTWSSSRVPRERPVRGRTDREGPRAGKVVGIAGGEEKCSEVVEKYGFDECVDYREARLTNASARPARRASICTSTMSVATFSTDAGEHCDALAHRDVWGDLSVQRHRTRRRHQYLAC